MAPSGDGRAPARCLQWPPHVHPGGTSLNAKRTLLGAALGLLLVPGVASAATPLDQVVALTNAERAKVGLAPLTVDPALAQAAEAYATTLATTDCFAHTCG